MSVVVAIKEDGKIYLGADSQVTKGGSRTTLKNKNNYKIWQVDGVDNCMMGHVGNVRDANIVRLMSGLVDDYDEYRDRINYRFVVKYIVPEIIKELKDAHFLKLDGDYLEYLNSSFIFAYKDKLFCINTDATVMEIDDYVAIGSGSQEALGSLLSTEGQNPKKRLVKAIKASAANDIYVDYPIILSDTEKCEFEVITEKNESKYIPQSNKKEGDNK